MRQKSWSMERWLKEWHRLRKRGSPESNDAALEMLALFLCAAPPDGWKELIKLKQGLYGDCPEGLKLAIDDFFKKTGELCKALEADAT